MGDLHENAEASNESEKARDHLNRRASQERRPSANLIAEETINSLDKSIPADAAFNDMRLFALRTIESIKNDGMTVAQQQVRIREIVESIHARQPQIPRELSDRDIVRLHDALDDYKASFTKGTSMSAIAEQIGQHDEVLFFDTGRTPSLKLQIGKKGTVQEARRVAENELNSILPKGSYLNDARIRLIEKTLTGGRSVKDWLARDTEIAREKAEAQESVLDASRDVTETVRSGGSAEDVNFAKQRLAEARDSLNKWRSNRHHYARRDTKQSINVALQSARTRLDRGGAPRKMTPNEIQTIGRLIGEYKEASNMTRQGVPRALLDAAVQKPSRPGLGKHQHPSNGIAQQSSAGASSPASGQQGGIKRSSTSTDTNLSTSPRPVKTLKKAPKFVSDAARDKRQTPITSYFSRQTQAAPVEAGQSGTVQPDSRAAGNGRGEGSPPERAEPGGDFSNQPDQRRRELASGPRERSCSQSER